MKQSGDNAPALLVGPKAPPVTGQSVAFEMLMVGLKGLREFDVVDLGERRLRRDAEFSSRRAFSVLVAVRNVWQRAKNSKLVYLQIAQSRWGFVRDCMIIYAAKIRGRKVVAHLHGGGYTEFYASQSRFFRSLIRMSLRAADRMIVLSEGLRGNFNFMGGGYLERLRVVPNASPVAIGKPKAAPKGTINLLYLSNLLVEKGYFDCIDALSHLQQMLPDVEIKLTLAGAFLLGADEYQSIRDLEGVTEKRIRYMNLESSIVLTGVVHDQEKQQLLDDAHFMLLPTYYRNEGQPISILEALARGTPCVATAWRGITDMMGDSECGMVVPPMTPLAIADAIKTLYNDPARYEECSRNAIDRAKDFSIDAYIGKLIDVFDEVSEPDQEPRAGATS